MAKKKAKSEIKDINISLGYKDGEARLAVHCEYDIFGFRARGKSEVCGKPTEIIKRYKPLLDASMAGDTDKVIEVISDEFGMSKKNVKKGMKAIMDLVEKLN